MLNWKIFFFSFCIFSERCCSGQGADLEKFLVTSGSVLDRLDRSHYIYQNLQIFLTGNHHFARWSTNWQNVATQKLERLGQQNSYDHDTVVKGQKVLESLMVESIDKCRFGGSRVVRRTTTRPTTPRPTTTTTTSTSTTSLRTIDSVVTENEALVLPESVDTYGEEDGEEDVEDIVEEEEEEDVVLLSGCVDQTRSGPVRVGVSRPGQAGGDFHLRLCEQETSGGGWTVGRSMSSSVVLTAAVTCMFLSVSPSA